MEDLITDLKKPFGQKLIDAHEMRNEINVISYTDILSYFLHKDKRRCLYDISLLEDVGQHLRLTRYSLK